MQQLDRYQKQVDTSTDPVGKSAAVWKNFGRSAARARTLETLIDMCPGVTRCMYCEDSQGTAIDHFRPRSTFPGSSFVWLNYLLACSFCNSNMKRDAFPLAPDGSPLLIDPTLVDPFEHLALAARTGEYVGRTDIGRATVVVFGLNRDECVRGRRNAWVAMEALILRYGATHRQQGSAATGRILTALTEYPFQGVRRWLGQIVRYGAPEALLSPETVSVVNTHPELLS